MALDPGARLHMRGEPYALRAASASGRRASWRRRPPGRRGRHAAAFSRRAFCGIVARGLRRGLSGPRGGLARAGQAPHDVRHGRPRPAPLRRLQSSRFCCWSRRGRGPARPGPQHFPVRRRGSSGRRSGANAWYSTCWTLALPAASPAAAPRRCLRRERHASGACPNVARSAGATGMAGSPGAERLLRLYVVIAFAAAPVLFGHLDSRVPDVRPRRHLVADCPRSGVGRRSVFRRHAGTAAGSPGVGRRQTAAAS